MWWYKNCSLGPLKREKVFLKKPDAVQGKLKFIQRRTRNGAEEWFALMRFWRNPYFNLRWVNFLRTKRFAVFMTGRIKRDTRSVLVRDVG